MAATSPAIVLKEALVERKVLHPDGQCRRVSANISAENSRALYKFVVRRRPKLVVEIGMGYGVSTLSILWALQENGAGRLVSIDPYIGWANWAAGSHVPDRASGRLPPPSQHLHECSHSALPKLLAEGLRPDLVYIDGNHNFDYVFVDVFFADKLLQPDGVIGFNDAGWRSVSKAIRFLRAYRRYRELDAGFPRHIAPGICCSR
jgi:hypothetical protein